jgi:hypothetical protein
MHVWPTLDALQRGRLYCNPTKCTLVSTCLVSVGSLPRNGTVSLDPAQVDALAAAVAPRTLADARHVRRPDRLAFRAPAQRSGGPRAPAGTLKTKMLKPLRRETTASCERVLMAGDWLPVHEQASQALLSMIRHACDLYLPDASDGLCIFTDANHLHWSACLFACPAGRMDLDHEPPAATARPRSARARSRPRASSGGPRRRRRSRPCIRPAGAHLYVDQQNMAACYNIVLGANHVAAGRVARWAAALASLPRKVHYLAGTNSIRAQAGPPSAGGANGAEGDLQAGRTTAVEGDAPTTGTAALGALRSLEDGGRTERAGTPSRSDRAQNLGLVMAASQTLR